MNLSFALLSASAAHGVPAQIAPDAEDAELLQEHDDPFLYKGKKPGMEARGAALVKFLFEQGVFPCAVSYEAVEERVQQLWKEATAWFVRARRARARMALRNTPLPYAVAPRTRRAC